MDGRDVRGRALALLLSSGTGVDDLCRAGVSGMPGVAGASVALMSSAMNRHAVYATDRIAREADDLQFELGEGPCIDAFLSGGPILADDLTAEPTRLRWPMFTRAAADAGAAAIFAFPLQVGAIRFGVLDLYRRRAGRLPATELTDALVLGDAVTLRLLADRGGPDADADLGDDSRAVVHQATGMTMVQLDLSAEDGLARLRAHAYAAGRPLRDVAGDVVARRLRFDKTTD